MKIKLLICVLLMGPFLKAEPPCCVSDYHCDPAIPRTRADNIPQTHIANMSNEYLTGYIQSLLDMHYYEFDVRVLVNGCKVFIFNLPNNALISNSIICFIYDIPCVTCVEPICCTPQEFICGLQSCNPVLAEQIACLSAYQVMCATLPCPQISAIWLPQNTLLFYPLIADPRQVMNSASLRFRDRVIGKHVGAASFGDDFIILRLKDVLYWRGDMDFGAQAGIFAVFDMDHPQASHVNTDFFVAFLTTYAYDKWSYRFRLWHLSSHLGDEFILANPTFKRRNLSDNGVDFFASYQFCRWLRLYAGLGYIFARDKSFEEKPFYMEFGTEIRVHGFRDCFDKLYIQPFLAMHFRSWEEHRYRIDQTYALGIEWSKIQGIGRKFRIYLEYHNGFSREGQFARERCSYFAIKTAYGF